jgi:hypothetical protein
MPDDLGSAPEGVHLYDRCNCWMHYPVLSKVSFLTLWGGEPGDGPGGAERMVELIRETTGRHATKGDS